MLPFSYRVKIKKINGPINESIRKKFSLLVTSKKPLSNSALFNEVNKYIWENYKNRVDEIILCESISDFFPNIFDIKVTGGTEKQNSYGSSIMNRVLSRISYKKYYKGNEDLFEEIGEKIEKMTHPSIWINNFKDAGTVDEIFDIFSDLDVDGEMKTYLENSRRRDASNAEFEKNWYKLETGYVVRDISEKCHGVYVGAFDENGERIRYEDDTHHVLLYLPKKWVKQNYVILPKHSEVFGVIYQFANYVHDGFKYEHGILVNFKKDRYIGKTKISTDNIYHYYEKELNFWPRPIDDSKNWYHIRNRRY